MMVDLTKKLAELAAINEMIENAVEEVKIFGTIAEVEAAKEARIDKYAEIEDFLLENGGKDRAAARHRAASLRKEKREERSVFDACQRKAKQKGGDMYNCYHNAGADPERKQMVVGRKIIKEAVQEARYMSGNSIAWGPSRASRRAETWGREALKEWNSAPAPTPTPTPEYLPWDYVPGEEERKDPSTEEYWMTDSQYYAWQEYCRAYAEAVEEDKLRGIYKKTLNIRVKYYCERKGVEFSDTPEFWLQYYKEANWDRFVFDYYNDQISLGPSAAVCCQAGGPARGLDPSITISMDSLHINLRRKGVLWVKPYARGARTECPLTPRGEKGESMEYTFTMTYSVVESEIIDFEFPALFKEGGYGEATSLADLFREAKEVLAATVAGILDDGKEVPADIKVAGGITVTVTNEDIKAVTHF